MQNLLLNNKFYSNFYFNKWRVFLFFNASIFRVILNSCISNTYIRISKKCQTILNLVKIKQKRIFFNFAINLFNISDDESSLYDRKKRPRTAFTASQIKALEQEFERNKYLSVSKRLQLSKQLKLTETQV